MPGIGAIDATALAAAAGDPRALRRGRDMAAWLGPAARRMTAGAKPRLPGIGKRGNRYLRKNLIHGARAVLPCLAARETARGQRARGLLARARKNVAVVALANQAGAHLLGGPGAWRHLRRRPRSGGRIEERLPARGVASRRPAGEVCAR